MAAGDLTSLPNVKGWMSPPLTNATDDELLKRLITAASQYIQTWLNRTIASTLYVETYNGTGGNRLILPNYPVTAVGSVAVNFTPIPAAPASSGSSGFLFDSFGLYLRGFSFTEGFQNVAVTYTAGFLTTPPELEQACIELVALRYKERDRVGQNSKSIGGEIVSFNTKDFTGPIQTILDSYKKVITF